jgi:hypothetical protein
MAYQSNTKDTVVQVIKVTDKTEIRVTQIADQDGTVKAVDIRQWYCTATDPIMKPTQKGVRVQDASCAELLNGIINACSSEALTNLDSLNSVVSVDTDNL